MLPSSLLATTGLGGAPRPYQRKAKKQSIVQGKQQITIETEQICKAFDQTTALLLQCEKEKKVHSGKDQKAYFTFHVKCKRRLWRRINQSILQEINSDYLLEGQILKLKYFGHIIRRELEFGQSLEASRGWGDWHAAVHGIMKSRT